MESTTEPQLLFRAGKKRKAYRQRVEDTDAQEKPIDATTEDQTPQPGYDVSVGDRQTTLEEPENDDEGASVARALKLRNARKKKLGGVAFRADSGRTDESDDNTGKELVAHSKDGTIQKPEPIIGGITKRFAPQTGIVGELVNKHMEEYIESELARRKRNAAQDSSQPTATSINAASLAARPDLAPTLAIRKPAMPAPAMQGRLQEIDLGDEARARTEALTERAMKRMQGDSVEEEDDGSGRPKKVRLGRDGKPWRPRNRRGSDDIKRDQLVDEFMRENKLDVYDLKEKQAPNLLGKDDDEMAADDRLAEQFRRDFMENMSQRRRRPKATTASKSAAKPSEEILRGPKLGGSRNVRSQMRNLLLKEQEKKR